MFLCLDLVAVCRCLSSTDVSPFLVVCIQLVPAVFPVLCTSAVLLCTVDIAANTGCGVGPTVRTYEHQEIPSRE
jgi:hypothetical protein